MARRLSKLVASPSAALSTVVLLVFFAQLNARAPFRGEANGGKTTESPNDSASPVHNGTCPPDNSTGTCIVTEYDANQKATQWVWMNNDDLFCSTNCSEGSATLTKDYDDAYFNSPGKSGRLSQGLEKAGFRMTENLRSKKSKKGETKEATIDEADDENEKGGAVEEPVSDPKKGSSTVLIIPLTSGRMLKKVRTADGKTYRFIFKPPHQQQVTKTQWKKVMKNAKDKKYWKTFTSMNTRKELGLDKDDGPTNVKSAMPDGDADRKKSDDTDGKGKRHDSDSDDEEDDEDDRKHASENETKEQKRARRIATREERHQKRGKTTTNEGRESSLTYLPDKEDPNGNKQVNRWRTDEHGHRETITEVDGDGHKDGPEHPKDDQPKPKTDEQGKLFRVSPPKSSEGDSESSSSSSSSSSSTSSGDKKPVMVKKENPDGPKKKRKPSNGTMTSKNSTGVEYYYDYYYITEFVNSTDNANGTSSDKDASKEP